MHIKIVNKETARVALLIIVRLLLQIVIPIKAIASDVRFNSYYFCGDGSKTCTSSGIRVADGFEIYRDCWEWEYTKNCNYPSKDNCAALSHCYFTGNGECLLRDSHGDCVNQLREFSCKSRENAISKNINVTTDITQKEGKSGIACSAIPCSDGNCVDKSYETNGEMMDSISKLYGISQMKPGRDGSFNLFAGSSMRCTRNPLNYKNCCTVKPKGWGKAFGAGCSSDEKRLMSLRGENLCIYVGQKKDKIKLTTKKYFCCFNSILDKVIQTEAKKQLGINFGSGSNPNCRGLTLEEIQKLDFDKIDFTEFIEDFKVKFFSNYKAPNPKSLGSKINSSTKNIIRYDNNLSNPNNNKGGWNNAASLENVEEVK